MKKQLLLTAVLLLCVLPISANSTKPAPGTYNCKSEDFQSNIKTAKYIVVVQLEKYLPDNMGEYRVLINLRGPFQPGHILWHFANRYNTASANSSVGKGVPIGGKRLIIGERSTLSDGAERVYPYECKGEYAVKKLSDNTRPAFDSIVDVILGQE